VHSSRNPAHQPGERGAAAEVAGRRGPAQVPLYGPAPAGQHAELDVPIVDTGRAGQYGFVDRPRARDGRIPARPHAGQNVDRVVRDGVQRGDLDHRFHAQRAGHLFPAQGQGGGERCAEGEVSGGRDVKMCYLKYEM